MLTSYKDKIINISVVELSVQLFSIFITLYFFSLVYFPGYRNFATLGLLVIQIIYILFHGKVLVNTSSLLWIVFTLLSIIGLLTAKIYDIEQIYYVESLIVMSLLMSILLSFNYVFELGINKINFGFFLISLLFVTGSVLQLINPNLLITINGTHLNNLHMEESIRFIQRGWVSGFSNQTGTNAFMMSVGLSYLFIGFFKQGKIFKKIILGLSIVLVLYLIFMTGKRGFILFNAVIMITLAPLLVRNKLTTPFAFITAISVFVIITMNTEIGQNILLRMDQDDVSSGRFLIYSEMINDIKRNLFWGSGTYSTRFTNSTFMDGHNIYLQVFRENGIFSLIIFMFFILKNIFMSLKILFKIAKSNEHYYNVALSIYGQLLFIMWGITGNPLYDMFALFFYFILVSFSNIIYKKLFKNKGDI
ncbi:O-antigen ligase family protein [Fundicoccus sp. Sow4_D5]|uniref:O-antigen ligase family protein n=1 Tax=Fundicoccus sp. Sow4_D5 TaxID=3438782 RepID=UPI003F8FDC6E